MIHSTHTIVITRNALNTLNCLVTLIILIIKKTRKNVFITRILQ